MDNIRNIVLDILDYMSEWSNDDDIKRVEFIKKMDK